ncbi:transposase [Streptomyces sp. NBC_01450]|uniref:transposase n=1 Tax=Streptomyces sp. NBC_01450 TaxID=2903871 RepID=UPI003FCE4694
MDTWRLGRESPEEAVPGGKQVHESLLGRVQAGRDRARASSGRTVTEVARELGVSSESLRGWVKKASAAQDTGLVPAA